jgi:tyrosyl-tRNA synthetase
MNLYDELSWRGMVSDATEGLADVFANERVTAYIGFDPTASSLHAGSLLTVMGLARLQRFDHAPIAIVGGGTGMIGDPSGKLRARAALGRADRGERRRDSHAARTVSISTRRGRPRIVNRR